MKQINVKTKPDHLGRVSSASPLKAIEELMWNGLDASAGHVEVKIIENGIGGVDEVRIIDNGDGIFHEHLDALFGDLGGSWKKDRKRHKGRSLHGKQGEGRFKAFSLGEQVTWKTCFEQDGQKYSYEIRGDVGRMETFKVSDPVPATGAHTGTEVVVTRITKSLSGLGIEAAIPELTKNFASYLSEYSNVNIVFRGEEVDPTPYQRNGATLVLPEIQLGPDDSVSAEISVVEWLIPTNRILYLCDQSGVTLHEVPIGIQAPGFVFTAHLKCDRFRDIHHAGDLGLEDLHPDVKKILAAAREQLRNHFRARLAEEQAGIVDRWKREGIYPFEDDKNLTPVEVAERQVFDILAVNVEAYLPKKDEADLESRKLTFRLLAMAVKENPNSVRRIISEVLNLKPEEQADLAEMLDHTSLSAVISTAKNVANRLDFLLSLENLLCDKETKKALLERDQLHKILENEPWIFNEEFALSCSEVRLENVLDLHLEKLGERSDEPGPVVREDGRTGRVDLMFSRAVHPRHDEHDYLIVELKRPSKKVDSVVLSQIESYALAVAKDSRFRNERARWDFMVVSEELDDFAKEKAQQSGRPKGLVFDHGTLNIRVWAFEWGEIIRDARARLHFLNERLGYEVNRDSATSYLVKAHEKYIPIIAKEIQSDHYESDSEEGEGE
ncbi:ATP-binding protein [Kiritimatiellota bacterium B12222]|nr:ATP-binding protein [Kiritimatiellota bacterium B12222]